VRRALVWVAVVLVVLGGGYVGDNMLRRYVESRAADAISAALDGAGGSPSVSLGGFPFAFSLLTRSVPQAHLTVDALPLEISGHQVELTDVVADTAAITLGAKTVTVASLTGTASLAYSDLAAIADVPITYSKVGRLELRYTRELFGKELSFAVSAVPKLDVDGQVIRLADPKLDLAGNDLPISLTQDQLDAIIEPIRVNLDHDLRLTSLIPRPDGLAIGVGGTNLSLPLP
jgi:LmeA-like phospholipid-binding